MYLNTATKSGLFERKKTSKDIKYEKLIKLSIFFFIKDFEKNCIWFLTKLSKSSFGHFDEILKHPSDIGQSVFHDFQCWATSLTSDTLMKRYIKI
jgi:hypothetical protein